MNSLKTLTLVAAGLLASARAQAAVWGESFSYPDGLITNEYAFARPTDPAARSSPVWIVESGSLFASGGTGWTGAPDDKTVNGGSNAGTGSALFVARTRKADFGDVALSLRLYNQGLVTTASTPRTNWDGAHVHLRYVNADQFYLFSVNRRDNTMVIKKRQAGVYTTLGSATLSVPYRKWQAAKVSALSNADGSVSLSMTVEGRTLSRRDAGTGGPAIRTAGAIVLRGDNANLKFDVLSADALGTPADAQAPAVSVTAPAAGNVAAGAVRLAASATDNVGVAGVQFFVDGQAAGAEDTAAPYETSWDSTKVADGAHTITATARDAAGNRSTSAAIGVTARNAPSPTPAPAGSVLFADSFDRADGPVDPAKWSVSAGAWSVRSGRAYAEAASMRAASVPAALKDVEVAFALRHDGFTASTGNAWDGINVVLRQVSATQAYTLSVARRDGRAVLKKQSGTTYTDLASAALPLALGSWRTIRARSVNQADGSVLLSLSVDGQAVMTFADRSSPYAGAGSIGVMGGNAKFWIDNLTAASLAPADAQAPTVAVTAPSAGATVSGTLALAASASDNAGVAAGVQFYVDGTAVGGEDTSAPYEASWDTTRTADGTHSITAAARDAAGNRTVSAPVSVAVQNAVSSGGGSVLFSDTFSLPDGPVDGSKWEVTSGAWRVVGGRAYTESSVFRANTRSYAFQNVEATFKLVNSRLTTSSGESWHGVHMFLRRLSQYHTYYLSINRRDNRALLKKKVPGGTSNGGTYYDLAAAAFTVPYGQTQLVKATAMNNADGSVTIALYVNDRLIVSATDRGVGGAPIRDPGSTGVRGDYTSFYVDDFTVRSLSGGSTAAEGPVLAPAPPGQPGGPSLPVEARAPQRFLSPGLPDGVNDAAEFGTDADEVSVFDASGRRVYQAAKPPGGRVRWDCRDGSGRLVDSGLYIARIRKRDLGLVFQSFAVVK